MIEQVPKIWVVADYGKTDFETPSKIELLNCRDTELTNVWSVITRAPYGPFGLIAEEIADGKFRGFFSISPMVIEKAVKTINETLRVNIDLSKNQWDLKHGSY